jgi:beta-lactamase regulating signal transducer with metallopeptidase domain
MTDKILNLSRVRKCDPAVVVFSVVLFATFAAGLIAAIEMPFARRMMPLSVCALGVVLCIASFVKFVTGPEKVIDPNAEEDVLSTFDGASEASDTATIRYGVWMLAYVVGLWATGLWVSTIVFTAAFLRIEHRSGPIQIVIVTGITLTTAYALGRLLNVTWPSGFLPF